MNAARNPSMTQVLQDCLRSMRLYVSPVFLRENPLVILAVFYTALCFTLAFLFWNVRSWHSGHYAIPPVLAPTWWVSLYAGFSAISLHYWRQVRTPTTYLLNRLQRAEYLAILVMALALGVLLALPPLLTGAPAVNCFALEAIAMVLWCSPRPVNRAAALRSVMTPLGIVRALGFIFLLVPRMQNYLFSMPWYTAIGIMIVCLGMVLHLYRLSDYRLAAQTPRPILDGSTKRISTVVERLSAVILWRPSWLVRLPLADPLQTGSPIAVILMVVVATLIFGGVTEIIAWMADGVAPSLIALRHRLPDLARQSLLLIGVSLSAWMTQRADWPFLLTLGPYGSKRAFAQAVYRLHLQRALQASLIAGTMIALTGWFDHRATLTWALAAGWSCGLALIGTSCLPTLAFIIPRLNRRATIAFLNIGAMVLGLQLATSLILQTGFWWRWLLAPASLIIAALFYVFVPPRLAAQDWPIEPPR